MLTVELRRSEITEEGEELHDEATYVCNACGEAPGIPATLFNVLNAGDCGCKWNAHGN